MSKEWGRDPQTEPDFTGFIFSAVFLISVSLALSAALNGCASYQWPEIGENVRVEKITIRECKQGEC